MRIRLARPPPPVPQYNLAKEENESDARMNLLPSWHVTRITLDNGKPGVELAFDVEPTVQAALKMDVDQTAELMISLGEAIDEHLRRAKELSVQQQSRCRSSNRG